jgi:hypothetical protein
VFEYFDWTPWQSPYVERLIGSIRRECLNDGIVLNERHLRRVLQSDVEYDHTWRPHRSFERDAPEPRAVQQPEVGGLHHYDERMAA